MNIKNYSKIDHKTLHFLPFLPSRKRTKGFALERVWGNLLLKISAQETINTYDLLTLLYMVKEYLLNGYNGGYLEIKIKGKIERKEIAGITIDTKKFLQERGISANKNNRETLKKSIERLKSINLTFINLKTKKETHTTYIYQFEVDEKIEEIAISANKKFIDFVINNGVLINLERLKLYGEKEQYAILLDLYLQGTKIAIKDKKHTKYIYREKFNNEEIEQALKLDFTKIKNSDKRLIIKKAFELLHEKGNLPLYTYNKTNNMWIKTFEEKEKNDNENRELQPQNRELQPQNRELQPQNRELQPQKEG